MTTTKTTGAPVADSLKQKRRKTRGLAVLATVIANLTIWAIAVPLAGTSLTVRLGTPTAAQHVGPAAIAFVSIFAGLAGWALLAIIERFSSRPRRVWITVATLVFAFSLAGPMGANGTTAATLVLACLHLATAAILIPILARTAGTPSPDQ